MPKGVPMAVSDKKFQRKLRGRKLEKEIENAIMEVIGRLGLRHLPLLPTQATMHLMAKAAVVVYETAARRCSAKEPASK
jgi:hypothetical protein